MSRARSFASLSLLLASSAVVAGMVGGIFDSPIGAPGASGSAGGVAGGGFTLRHSIAHPQGAVALMKGGAFELQSGFVDAARGAGPAPAAVGSPLASSARFDAVVGRFLGFAPGRALEVAFSQPMNPASFPAGILLKRIEFPFGVPLAAPQPVALDFAYDTATYRVTLQPSSGTLAYNSVYSLILSTGLLDFADVRIAEVKVSQFSTLAKESEDNLMVAADSATAVSVPPAAAPADFYTLMRVDPLSNPERMDPAAYQEATRKAETSYDAYLKPIPGAVREFTAYDSSQRLIESFSKPVTVEIPFKDADGDGIVDGTSPPIRVSRLAIWFLDEPRKLWVRLPNPVIDSQRGVISAQTTHFSAFAVIGAMDTSLDLVRVYPIPFRPNAGDPARYGRAGEGVHFDNLPDTAEITLYTLTGREVKRIRHSGIAEERWQGDNSDGQRVASGVYRYVIRSGKNTKVGRLMIIW